MRLRDYDSPEEAWGQSADDRSYLLFGPFSTDANTRRPMPPRRLGTERVEQGGAHRSATSSQGALAERQFAIPERSGVAPRWQNRAISTSESWR